MDSHSNSPTQCNPTPADIAADIAAYSRRPPLRVFPFTAKWSDPPHQPPPQPKPTPAPEASLYPDPGLVLMANVLVEYPFCFFDSPYAESSDSDEEDEQDNLSPPDAAFSAEIRQP